jgi:hypothetical protein
VLYQLAYRQPSQLLRASACVDFQAERNNRPFRCRSGLELLNRSDNYLAINPRACGVGFTPTKNVDIRARLALFQR